MINDTPPPPATRSDTDKVLGLVNYVLLFFGHWTGGVTAVIAVVLAYIRRSDADALTATHYAFQIKTFWISLILAVIGFVLIGFAVMTGIGAGFTAAGDWTGAAVGLGLWTGLLVFACVGAFIASFFWVLIASIVGFIKLAGNDPMGRRL